MTLTVSQNFCNNQPLVTGFCYERGQGFFNSLYEIIRAIFFEKCNYKYTTTKENCCFQVNYDVLSHKRISWDQECQKTSPSLLKKIHQNQITLFSIDNLLIDKINQEYREVAKNMGVNNLEPFFVRHINKKTIFDDISFGASVGLGGQLDINSELAYGLCGWPSAYTKDQARGVLAHEVAHILLQHSRKKELANIDKVSREKLERIYNNHEVEADCLTITVPVYAKGLRDAFSTLIEKCDQPEFIPCYNIHNTGTHPPFHQRVEYLTHLLQVMDKNIDSAPSPHNATCPVF